jgi:hypothetical protein
MTQFKQFQNLTVNTWVNLNTEGDYTIADSPGVFEVGYRNDTNGFLFEVVDSSDTTFTVRQGSSTTTGVWKMVTLVYDQSSLEGYVDASSVGTATANGNATKNGSSGIRKGGIDGKGQEFRVYDAALTSSEVQQLYDVVDTPGTLVSSKKQL